jgi:hypothetical protein
MLGQSKVYGPGGLHAHQVVFVQNIFDVVRVGLVCTPREVVYASGVECWRIPSNFQRVPRRLALLDVPTLPRLRNTSVPWVQKKSTADSNMSSDGFEPSSLTPRHLPDYTMAVIELVFSTGSSLHMSPGLLSLDPEEG